MTPQPNPSVQRWAPKSRDFELYQLLVDETHYLHEVWFANYKLVMTFNTLLLPSMLAVFALVAKGELTKVDKRSVLILIAFIAVIGIIVNLIRVQLIRRINAIMGLRTRQIRRLEATLITDFSVAPFHEGYALFGGEVDSTSPDLESAFVRPGRFRFAAVNAFSSYLVTAALFIIAYCFIGLLIVRALSSP